MLFCPQCGVRLEEGARFCYECGTPVFPGGDVQPQAVPGPPPSVQPAYYAPQPYGYPPGYGYPPYHVRKRTGLPIAGGALSIVAGVLGLCTAVFVFLFYAIPFGGYYFFGLTLVCGSIMIVFSIFAIIGGICALRRRHFALALTGAILGIFTFGFYVFAPILGIIATILIAISGDEFEKTTY